jgi:geranylgeranyl diphosphate synthase type II
MDDDDLRRGKPTNHKVFGEALAVLAGDGLLNEAMNVMFDYCINVDSSAISACSLISKAAGAEGMIAGQVVDILSTGQSIGSDVLYYMHKKKTGELIKASILAGAILANAPTNEIEALGNYGNKLGLAFQIKDDVLDVIGETELLGKKINSDTAQNKTTFVTINGLEKCIELCSNLTEECIMILNNLSRNTENLIEITKFLLEREY